MSTLRSRWMPRPVHAMVARKVTSTAAKSGVNSRLSTGAMFSITLCFASTSHDATTTAPAAPHGTSHRSTNHSASAPMLAKIPIVNIVSTAPPSAMSTK